MKNLEANARDLVTDEEIDRYWSSKLIESADNAYPLAPRDLRIMDLVNYENYKTQSSNFTLASTQTMVPEFRGIAKKAHVIQDSYLVEIFGPGLSNRDIRWMGAVHELGCFKIHARDISTVAINKFLSIYKSDVLEQRTEIIHGEIETTLETHRLDKQRTIAYFASQFFSVLSEAKMTRVLSHVGVIMDQWPQNSLVKPSLYLIHPLPEDNAGPKMWDGVKLPGVLWGDTTPYVLEQIRLAVELGLVGKNAMIKILDKFYFFHQLWSIIKITLT